MLWNIQLVLSEFIGGLRKDRVPVQKKIIAKLKVELEKQKLVLKGVTANHVERIKSLVLGESSIFLWSLCQLSKPLTEFLEYHLVDMIEEREVHATEVNLYTLQS
jgi:hypothetical protein